jgi:branched-chain amino acid transport system permease protein
VILIIRYMPDGIWGFVNLATERWQSKARLRAAGPALQLRPATVGGDIVLSVRGLSKYFGGLKAVDHVDIDVRRGGVHALIGPNGSGKTTTLNVISGYYTPEAGRVALGSHDLAHGIPQLRAGLGIARTFQTPRLIGEASVLQNVMIGGTVDGTATFVESLLALPRHWRDEAMLRAEAMLALHAVGLEALAAVRADRLQHSELRFMEIARALMLHPVFLLLDEPAAGLSADEIQRLGGLIKEISRCGTGVLLVEHHADLIFDICDRVTVLNLGKILAAGTPSEIRLHREVVVAYLGS